MAKWEQKLSLNQTNSFLHEPAIYNKFLGSFQIFMNAIYHEWRWPMREGNDAHARALWSVACALPPNHLHGEESIYNKN
jgi:hypothetical protein